MSVIIVLFVLTVHFIGLTTVLADVTFVLPLITLVGACTSRWWVNLVGMVWAVGTGVQWVFMNDGCGAEFTSEYCRAVLLETIFVFICRIL
jgi:hypothetical protein